MISARTEIVTIPCRISRSGFSDERVFRMTLADGLDYVGGTGREYCFTRDNKPLGIDQPARGETLEGRIMAAVIRPGEDRTLVSVPDGTVFKVANDSLKPYTEVSPGVPVKS